MLAFAELESGVSVPPGFDRMPRDPQQWNIHVYYPKTHTSVLLGEGVSPVFLGNDHVLWQTSRGLFLANLLSGEVSLVLPSTSRSVEKNVYVSLDGTHVAGVMKPTRDVDPFLAITRALGIDPFNQPVSCPPAYGYGGAMGPAQFIPSTWVLYQDRISRAAGHAGTQANPFDNLDAFTATAIYMADLGATAQTPAAERTAALKYFAGGNYKNPAYSFYGDGVMGFADQFENDIQTLGN